MTASAFVDTKLFAEKLKISEDEARQMLSLPSIETKTPVSQYTGLYIYQNNISIYHDDFITSRLLADNSVDLIVTSPPYNVGIDYSTHDDSHGYNDYLDFSRLWLTQAYRVSRSDGRMCLNIPLDKNKGGQQSVYADLTRIAKDIGWQYQSTIVWNEGNISRRTAWGSWMSASAPFVIAPVEMIVVLYKNKWKKLNKGKSDVTRDEFMAWTNGMWTFNGESKKRIGHPAPFPHELPRRCIKLFSYNGDTILDPFSGSSTTLLEASANERVGVGFDIALEYCELSKKRLEQLWQSQNQAKLL